MKILSKTMVFSLLVMALTSCSIFAPVPTKTPASTNTIVPTSINAPEPTSTQTATLIPQYTKTAKPSTVVDAQDGKQFISHEYGFSILLPSDSHSVVYNRADLFEILTVALPEIHLDDGGNIVSWLHSWVEDQADNCHPWQLSDPDVLVKVEKITLGGTHFTKAYTPDLDKDAMQHVEYMTYGTNFCVHFGIGLTTYYFDRGDAEPGNMLPYMQDELDRIISTFQWVEP